MTASFGGDVKTFGYLPEATVLESENNAVELSKEWNGDSIRRSILLFLKTSESWVMLGKEKRASFCLRESAKLSLLISDYKKAFSALNAALELDIKIKDNEGKALTFSLLSRAANQKGEVKKSEKYYKQALFFSKFTSTDQAQANALFSAGEFNASYGNIKETINLFEQALSFAEKTEDKNLTAQILLNIGYSYTRESDPVYGLQKLKEALLKWEEIDNKRGQALANFGIGWLYTLTDEKQSALEFYRRAESMFPEDVDWLEKAKLFNGLATIYEKYGDLILGENYRRKALELYKKAEYPYGQIPTLISLAKLSFQKGEKSSGENLFQEAYSLAKVMNDDFHLAVISENFGNLYFASGEFHKAVNKYQEALSVYERLNVVLPRIENSLGKAYEKTGDYKSARRFYNSALKKNRKIKDVIRAAENLTSLAQLSKAEGQPEAALSHIRESLSITDAVYYDVNNNNLRKNYLSSVIDRYELYINLLMNLYKSSQNKNFLIEALQAAEKSRARLMSENLQFAGNNLVPGETSQPIKREKEILSLLNAKADKLTDLLSRENDKTEVDKLDIEIRELENDLEEVKAAIKQSNPIYSAIKNPAAFDITEFQNQILDENSLLLEFSLGEQESYLWVIEKSEINSHVLPGRSQIESKARKIHALLIEREIKPDESFEGYQARIAEADKNYLIEAQNLSNELFGQISGKFTGKRLIIVPDGRLHYIPVSALPLPDSKTGEPILFTHEVIYEPSALMLSLLIKNEVKSTPAVKDLLVFSDPVFSSGDERLPLNSQTDKTTNSEQTTALSSFRFAESLNSLPRLTASRDEAEEILNITGFSKSDTFSGFAANRGQLLNSKVSEYKIIHFATHSLVNEERPELSGILLSRFDEKGKKLNEFVRLQDIYALRLNSDLVVLSACNSGVGKELKGEGLMSLNNAFLQSGAKSVLSSLWKVEDNAAKELMKNFYQGLVSENQNASQALRQAQIKLSRNPQYKSPFYWAAFTIHGNYQTTPQLSGKTNYKIYFLLIIPFLIFGIYRLAKFKLLRRKIVDNN